MPTRDTAASLLLARQSRTANRIWFFISRLGRMRIADLRGSVTGLRRKLLALAAVLRDPAATEHERANAEALKRQLEERLRQAGAPEGDWMDVAFRLGKAVKNAKKSTSPESRKTDRTGGAFRLGRVLRRGYKKWLSE
jgi:hypothetical protein